MISSEFKNTLLRYAVYSAGLYAVFIILLTLSGHSIMDPKKVLGGWIPVVSLYFGLKKYIETSKKFTFKVLDTFSLGILFYLIYCGALFIILSLLYPLIGDIVQNLYLEDFAAQSEQLKEVISENMYGFLEKSTKNINFFVILVSDLVNKFLGGLIICLLLAFIFKYNKPLYKKD